MQHITIALTIQKLFSFKEYSVTPLRRQLLHCGNAIDQSKILIYIYVYTIYHSLFIRHSQCLLITQGCVNGIASALELHSLCQWYFAANVFVEKPFCFCGYGTGAVSQVPGIMYQAAVVSLALNNKCMD